MVDKLTLKLNHYSVNFNDYDTPMIGFFLFLNYIVTQAGFALIEAGSVRSRNTTNILIKNVMDLRK